MLMGTIIVTVTLAGCTVSPYRQAKFGEIVESKYLSYHVPKGEFKIHKNYLREKSRYKEGTYDLYNWNVKGGSYEVRLSTWPFSYMSINILFDKDGDYEERSQYLSNTPETLAQNREQGITYDKDETLYVLGMKCLSNVFSRNFGGSAYSMVSKDYSITCGYYHKTEGKRILRIVYPYTYALGDTRLQKDRHLERSELVSQNEIERQVKEAVKGVIKTLEIKDFDRDRMEREGLMHYDKPFKSMKW